MINFKHTIRDKRIRAIIGSIIAIMAIAVIYCYPDIIQGNILQQPDIRQGLAVGNEAKLYKEYTGETTFWTNSLFGGMPTFQISPDYSSNRLLRWIYPVLSLGLPSPANLIFVMMLGFFILLLSLDMRWYICLFGAIAWGLSSYFMILIGAGHIWKYLTLAYIPPTIAGIVLCYRGRYVAGTAITSFFGMLQLQSNHVQMTYYFLFVIIGMIISYLIVSYRNNKIKRWCVSSLCLVGAAVLAISANLPNLYNTYEYSKETIRGKYSDLIADTAHIDNGLGLDRDYITQYSYEKSETFSLLIPNIKGGASHIPKKGSIEAKTLADLDATNDIIASGRISRQTAYFLQYLSQYFGGEEGTNGPVYIGAIIVVLFFIGCMIVNGPLKWTLLILTIVSIMLAWGRNFMWLTDLFIDYIPMYNKFRTPESILVITQFTMLLIGIMALQKIIQIHDRGEMLLYKNKILICFAIGLIICMLGYFSPNIYGSVINGYELEMGINQNPELYSVVTSLRLDLIRHDSIRSALIILCGFIAVIMFFNRKLSNKKLVAFLGVLVLLDLYVIDKRYLNHDCFMPNQELEHSFNLTEADRIILADTSINYRVMDNKRFSSPDPSFYHKMIGGYHPAKLTRYQDLIDYYLNGQHNYLNILNMLNTKYIIEDPDVAPYINLNAMGNAWLVDSISYVETPNEEIAAIENLDLSRLAVADSRFEAVLGATRYKENGDTIFETSYAPNLLTYHVRTKKGGIAVFSEIYFPWGWIAYVDDEPVDIGRVNYILRAINVPAGEHKIDMRFDPPSVSYTVNVAKIGIVVIYMLLLISFWLWINRIRKLTQ